MPTVNYMCLPGIPMPLFTEANHYNMIIDTIIQVEGVDRDTVFARGRKRELVFCRQLICWFLRRLTNLTLSAIARAINACDHTTVIYSIKAISNLRDTDPHVRNLLLFYDQKLQHDLYGTEKLTLLFTQGREMAKT